MRFPHHLLKTSTIRSEPLLAAMAVVAIGMFIGAWVIGPVITHTNVEAPISQPQSSQDNSKMTFDAMVALPDPPPYRAATPAFEMSGPPNYGALAKQKAQAEVGGQFTEDDAMAEPAREAPSHRRSSRYYRPFDQHRVY